MKVLLPTILSVAMLSGCTTDSSTEVQPIPGSITYGGQPRTKLTKSPPGSVIYNSFYDSTGSRVKETYILQPDRTLKLTRRVIVPDFPSRNGS
ncbi:MULTISPECIES: hypothetical protein [unclassified Rhizobium]|uniref:hypothetical protein n=1 Tax=unclassified Rhizobium TaxID=2613769 RepID=UPI000271D397|nr:MULTISPECIES: hypothetical protein [unclassified Rhizobium]EJL53123.1 hypothetical protein PMI09_03434 [Rhizobium sp. CF122]MBB3393863.1 hypothetical protein [Rhizobium sp. BK060]MBB4169156.1 hypothetical protein [Rhizobium sp. BK538]TCM71927.1 hypothetical protein EV291_12229 [Rhizobium sp. BK068]